MDAIVHRPGEGELHPVGASPRPHRARSAPVAAEPRREDPRPRYPPAPPGSRPAAEAEQLSFEDPPAGEQ